MDLQLRSKVILIAGENAAMGLAVMESLAGEGAIPCLVGNWTGADEEKFPGVSPDLVIIRKKLTDKKDCHEVVVNITRRFGRIDALVNICPEPGRQGLEEGTTDGFEAELQESLLPVYLLAQEILPALKERSGVILNILPADRNSRLPGKLGFSGVSGGHAALTREWAVELLPFGIRVNALVLTSGDDGPATEKYRRIGSSAAFLLSPRSGHTTGQLVYVENEGTVSAIQ